MNVLLSEAYMEDKCMQHMQYPQYMQQHSSMNSIAPGFGTDIPHQACFHNDMGSQRRSVRFLLLLQTIAVVATTSFTLLPPALQNRRI